MFKKIKINSKKIVAFFLVLFVYPTFSFAWQVETIFGFTVDSEKGPVIGNFIDNTLNFIYALSGFLIILRLTLAGFDYMNSKGNPQQTKKAKDKIWHAVEGLLIIFGAFLFAQLVGGDILTKYIY